MSELFVENTALLLDKS